MEIHLSILNEESFPVQKSVTQEKIVRIIAEKINIVTLNSKKWLDYFIKQLVLKSQNTHDNKKFKQTKPYSVLGFQTREND